MFLAILVNFVIQIFALQPQLVNLAILVNPTHLQPMVENNKKFDILKKI
mgnify:CR=1 FL=1